jgi:glycopeptide antibiotics resistance protein
MGPFDSAQGRPTMILRIAFVGWLCIWAWIGLPWQSFQSTPSFQRVEWVPFAIKGAQTQVLNFLAFVPLGILGTCLGWRPGTILLVAVGVSGVTELLQVFSATRFPTATDLILNTAGALAGMTWPARFTPKRRG